MLALNRYITAIDSRTLPNYFGLYYAELSRSVIANFADDGHFLVLSGKSHRGRAFPMQMSTRFLNYWAGFYRAFHCCSLKFYSFFVFGVGVFHANFGIFLIDFETHFNRLLICVFVSILTNDRTVTINMAK